MQGVSFENRKLILCFRLIRQHRKLENTFKRKITSDIGYVINFQQKKIALLQIQYGAYKRNKVVPNKTVKIKKNLPRKLTIKIISNGKIKSKSNTKIVKRSKKIIKIANWSCRNCHSDAKTVKIQTKNHSISRNK